ncbi:MAG: GNAT family N-acetyltransferase [Theionarchaea archaeon]|nr:GNAT family N-acetyltransferase [Theionarchaea archaeon]
MDSEKEAISAVREHKDPEIGLRNATDSDCGFLYTLHKATLKEHVEKTWGWDEVFQKNHFREHFNPETLQIVMAANTDIGCMSVTEKGDHIFLNRIEILPAYQNRGIGTFLIRKIVTQAENKNKSVFLQVLKSNGRAKALYERLGFSVCGETATHYQMEYIQQ